MEKIAIIIDSTCSLPDCYLEQYPIKVARLKVVYPDKEYIDGIDITPAQVYAQLPEKTPTTSMPTVDDLNTIYDTLIKEGYTHVIGLPISSGLSGTINSFRIAAQNYESQIVSCIYDFKHLSMAIGLSVLKIAKMIQEGSSFKKICDTLPLLQSNTHMYFTVQTLDYLIKGGRIGKVSGHLGNLLNLKPIITMDENGSYVTHSKVRGMKQAFTSLEKLAHTFLEEGPCDIAIMTGTMKDEAFLLKEHLSNHPHTRFLHVGELTPVVGVHSGPALLAVAILSLNSL